MLFTPNILGLLSNGNIVMAVKTIGWKNDRIIMLDQRLLPHKEVYRICRNYQEVALAIRGMVIRGAPAIGVAAAMGVALGATQTQKNFDREFERILLTLSKPGPPRSTCSGLWNACAKFILTTGAEAWKVSNAYLKMRRKRFIKTISPPTNS